MVAELKKKYDGWWGLGCGISGDNIRLTINSHTDWEKSCTYKYQNHSHGWNLEQIAGKKKLSMGSKVAEWIRKSFSNLPCSQMLLKRFQKKKDDLFT